MAATTNKERSPLLPATCPRANGNGGGSALNPRAASFTFVPGRATSPSFTAVPVITFPAPSPSLSISPAAAPTPALTSGSMTLTTIANEDDSASSVPVKESGFEPLVVMTPPASTSPSAKPAAAQLASTILVRSRSQSDASSSSQQSVKSAVSSSSSSSNTSVSLCDACPTRRAFQRAHYVQFAASALLVSLAFILLTWWKHEVRFADLVIGASAWLAGEALKQVVFELLTRESKNLDGSSTPGTGLVLPTSVHAVLQELLRLGAIILVVALLPDPEVVVVPNTYGGMTVPTLPPTSGRRHHRSEPTRPPLPPLDVLFFSALWFAMGWALVEIVWGSRDFWRRMKLYDDVLDEDIKLDEEANSTSFMTENPLERQTTEYGTSALTGNQGLDKSHDDSLEVSAFEREVEARLEMETDTAELDARIRELEREEVEAQLGVPLYEIPVAVVVIWRIDSILLSLVATLVISLPFRTSAPTLIAFPIWRTFSAVALIHVLLSMMWTLRVRHVGIPAISYATLIILLFLLFAALAAWGALE